MQFTKRRRLGLLAVPLAFSLLAAACGGDDDDSGDGGGESAAGGVECLSFADLYALIGPESEGFGDWSDAQDLATELGSDTQFPDEPLELTGPGEESGTYDSFVEIALEGIAEDRGQEPTTRSDYASSGEDNVIVENVLASETSLGWVGWAFAKEQGDAVSNFGIAEEAGGECVEPTDDTIADGSYPLARSLYIYVNTAKAEENPAVAAFVDFYLEDLATWTSGAGYVALPEDRIEASRSAWEDAGISADGEISGNINVSGSSTVEPITASVAQAFDAENGTATAVDGPGTGDGFELFCQGQTDISDASRQIAEDEIAACEEAGIEYVEIEVGIDGMAVMTAGS